MNKEEQQSKPESKQVNEQQQDVFANDAFYMEIKRKQAKEKERQMEFKMELD